MKDPNSDAFKERIKADAAKIKEQSRARERSERAELMSLEAINARVKASLEASKKSAIQGLGGLMQDLRKLMPEEREMLLEHLKGIYNDIEKTIEMPGLKDTNLYREIKQALNNSDSKTLGIVFQKFTVIILKSNDQSLKQVLLSIKDQ